MKVMFDYQIFQMQKFGGISRYFFELLRENQDDKELSLNLDLMFSQNDYLHGAQFDHGLLIKSEKLFSKSYRLINKVNQYHSMFSMKLKGADIFHPTFYEAYFLNNIKLPYVLTVYDLINEKYPQYFQNNEEFIERKRKLITGARKVIAISNNTKNDIVNFFKVDPDKIEVTYLADSLSGIGISKIDNLPDNYILYTGKRGGYKNFSSLYECVLPFLKELKDLHLVCAGGGNFSKDELEKFKSDGVNGQIKYFSFNSNNELKYIYSKSLFFVLPSLYEGFGIPVLESYTSGALTILSDSSSLKEIGEDGAIYFDPTNSKTLTDALEKALQIKYFKKSLDIYSSKAFEISKKYSWNKTYLDTKNVYKGILK